MCWTTSSLWSGQNRRSIERVASGYPRNFPDSANRPSLANGDDGVFFSAAFVGIGNADPIGSTAVFGVEIHKLHLCPVDGLGDASGSSPEVHGHPTIVVVEHRNELEACTERFEISAKRRHSDVI